MSKKQKRKALKQLCKEMGLKDHRVADSMAREIRREIAKVKSVKRGTFKPIQDDDILVS